MVLNSLLREGKILSEKDFFSLRGVARKDDWGFDFRLKIFCGGSILLIYSSGPNGADENGSGDDILLDRDMKRVIEKCK